MVTQEELQVADGKYTCFVNRETAYLIIYRHNEPWKIPIEDKFLYALVTEAMDTKKQNKALLKLLEVYKKLGECISELETAEYEYERTINGK